MKIVLLVLLILLGLIVWLVFAILSSLIVIKIFMARNKRFWAVVCTLFAPAAFIVIVVLLLFYFVYAVVRYILER